MIKAELWQSCRELLAAGALSEVAAELAALPTEADEDLAWLELRAYVANALGDFAAAETALRQAIALYPAANLFLLLASNLHKQQRFRDAREQLNAVLLLQPDLWMAHFNLAQGYLAENQAAAALAELRFCLADQPDNSELLFQIATVHCQLDQPTEAMPYLQTLLRLAPHHVEALNNYGVCHVKAGDYAAAIHCFATAMRADDQHLPSRSNLAVSLLKECRYQEALVHFEEYLQLAPYDAEATYNAGVTALLLANLEQATTYFSKVLSLGHASVPSLLNLAAIALKKDDASAAIRFYQRVLAEEPDQAIATYMLAALMGTETPAKAPVAYVTALFDQYAAHFDQHLLMGLDYQTPQKLRQLYEQVRSISDAATPLRTLDLGCGTGLSAAAFSDVSMHMIGIDLSAQMLAQARAKKLYQQLLQVDLLDYLSEQTGEFDVMIAADVVVYLGDLTAFLSLAAQRLAPGGLLLFSIETARIKTPFALTKSGRFQHQLKALLAQATNVGLRCLAQEQVTLRQQDKQPVTGTILALQRTIHA